MNRKIALVVAALGVVGAGSLASAEVVYAITGATAGSSLIQFDSASPGSAISIGSLTGIPAGHSVRAIDFRPATGELYAMSTNATNGYNIYTVNLSTAALSLVGGGTTTTGNFPSRVSIDFNPVVDRIRVVAGNNLNLRINPITGALAAQDANIAYAAGDPNNTALAAFPADAAYSNNVAGATSTTMYVFDFNRDVLSTQGSLGGVISPNTGQLFTVGVAVGLTDPTGFLTNDAGIGFDISSQTGIAYLSYQDDEPGFAETFSTINLSNGLVTPIGAFNGFNVMDISVAIPEPSALGLLAVPALALVRRRRA